MRISEVSIRNTLIEVHVGFHQALTAQGNDIRTAYEKAENSEEKTSLFRLWEEVLEEIDINHKKIQSYRLTRPINRRRL